MNRGYVHGIAAPPPAPTLLPPVSAIPMQRGFPTRALLGHWNVTTDSRLEIVVLGDSIASGQGATSNASSWVGRLRARLQQQYGGNGGEGFIGPYDTRVTKTGWGLISSLPPWNGCYSNNDSSSNLMTYTFTGGQVIDRVDVFYADAGDTTNFDPNIEIRHNNKYLKASREQLIGMYVAGKMEPATAKGLFTPESLAPEVVAPATNATEKAAEKK